MSKSVWQNLELNEGILRESIADTGRIVLWLPGSHAGGFQHWERVGNVPSADIAAEQGICATAATLVPARQRKGGLLGKLFGGFGKSADQQSWFLPTGESAEQAGARQTDLILVWSEHDTAALDEARIRSRWPQATRLEQLGKNLYLLAGVKLEVTRTDAPPGCPQEQAEHLLAEARKIGDRLKEVSALTDLGTVLARSGKAKEAIAPLEEAISLARQLGDRGKESDALGNLGLALITAGNPNRAVECLQQQLAYARESKNRFEEKLALTSLGHAQIGFREHARAVSFYEQALAIAREVGDRSHEADLLWFSSVECAELGKRDEAIAKAQQAIELLEKMKNPHVSVLKEHLQKYQAGEVGVWSPNAASSSPAPVPGAWQSWSTTSETWAPQPFAAPGPGPTSGPGLLRMAFSAAKSMAKFIGSGAKTVPPAVQQKRLRTCATCEHHTGVRCKLCGCFTSVKAWLPHENCPIGKWPS